MTLTTRATTRRVVIFGGSVIDANSIQNFFIGETF